jgi:hypothetical protein
VLVSTGKRPRLSARPLPRALSPGWARPDELETFLTFHLDQGGVDRSREARIVQLDREVIALGVLRGLLPSRAQLDIAGEDSEVRALFRGVLDATSLALALRARVRTVPVKPLPFEVKVPMVAIVVSFQFPGPRPSRPRWLATDRRRSTRTPKGPAHSRGQPGRLSCLAQGMDAQRPGEESRNRLLRG